MKGKGQMYRRLEHDPRAIRQADKLRENRQKNKRFSYEEYLKIREINRAAGGR